MMRKAEISGRSSMNLRRRMRYLSWYYTIVRKAARFQEEVQ